MPNWCSTNYTITGDKKEVKDFREKLIEISSRPERLKSDFGKLWLGNILDYFGFDWEEIYCRGNIVYLDASFDENSPSFGFATETAWGPMNNVFESIFKKQYPSLKYYFSAEEPGVCLFEKNDSNGLYYPEQFLLDISGDNEKGEYLEVYEYYDTLEELLKEASKIFNKSFLSTGEIMEYLEEIEENHDGHYGLYEFELVD